MSPELAASCTCPELLRACLIYIDDYGGNLLCEDAKATLEPVRVFARGSGRDVCAAPSMDVWAVGVLVFELLRTGQEALFGSKREVRGRADADVRLYRPPLPLIAFATQSHFTGSLFDTPTDIQQPCPAFLHPPHAAN